MDYRQALDYILGTPNTGEVNGRDVMKALMAELGDPQKDTKYVHIAGTNGKGSTSAFLASILRKAGYRTGLYTSPFIQRFNERIQVDGVQIPDEALAEITTRVAAAADSIQEKGFRRPTIFELITALGFCWFSRCRCDIVVLEVGLGGRLDATNVIDSAEAYVMVNIGYDHMEMLGDTLPKIAAEKAGIIKDGGRTVVYGQSPEVEEVFRQACREHGSEFIRSDNASAKVRERSLKGTCFDFDGFEKLRISLLGRYQVCNACTAVTTVRALRAGGWKISAKAMRDGLKSAKWPGRMELMKQKPVIIVDGAHNPQGVQALMEGMEELFPGKKLNIVIGVLADKDYISGINAAMGHAKKFFTVTPDSYRALSAERLAEEISSRRSVPAEAFEGIPQAIEAAERQSDADDVICIFGSLYQVGEIRSYFGRNEF
ncbi:MAG: bifunctional folylpolyglutamate synthase/dihydrofolate synthase [Oscillospiraceae bacterium]|nr:bifunctional folylpolyglutamate synthase/dihydrofolate synthase [Oscillospiraceae bacterium]